MHRFFVEEPGMAEDSMTITGGDVNHIKNVLRMSVGDHICVINGQNNKEYDCEIISIGNEEIETKICEIRESDQELENHIVLFQGLPKSDKMELIIQKAVELGVYKIVPVSTERTVVKLDAKKEANKRKRWMNISESAAKQSGRLYIPEVTQVVSYTEALAMAEKMDVRLIPYELAVAVFIGPEGGFESGEIEKAMETGVQPITLGKRILRTETAGLVTLAMLVYNLER